MKLLLPLILLAVAAPWAQAGPHVYADKELAAAWALSGNGLKPVECYFWATKTVVSTVACQPLKHPTDEVRVILPADATDFYHTHPKGCPQLSEQDLAAQRKSHIRIHVISL